jgi:leader peptidase (prepilin peptidase)/N-methyltransferase
MSDLASALPASLDIGPPPLEMVLRHPLITAMVLAFGACVGSFLNVVIYRLPLNLSVLHPKRSFCPSCKTQIPAWQNLPILSWILLRGKCAKCQAPISVRYLLVEAFTAGIFLAIWWRFLPDGWGVPAVHWVLVSLLIAATFIDAEHLIIPDGLTWKAAIAGGVLAALLPALDARFPSAGILNTAALGAQTLPNAPWHRALLLSALGFASGYGLLWSVVKLGKLAFGKFTHVFAEDTTWVIHEPGDDAEPQLEAGEFTHLWSEMFGSEQDRLVIECTEVAVDGVVRPAPGGVVLHFNRALIDGSELPLEDVKKLQGVTRRIVRPREAMGMGDVKFVGMIGAFLGWPVTVFCLMGGSVIGAIGGLTQQWLAARRHSKPIPFGPYLALATLVYLFTGPELIRWYLHSCGLR